MPVEFPAVGQRVDYGRCTTEPAAVEPARCFHLSQAMMKAFTRFVDCNPMTGSVDPTALTRGQEDACPTLAQHFQHKV